MSKLLRLLLWKNHPRNLLLQLSKPEFQHGELSLLLIPSLNLLQRLWKCQFLPQLLPRWKPLSKNPYLNQSLRLFRYNSHLHLLPPLHKRS